MSGVRPTRRRLTGRVQAHETGPLFAPGSEYVPPCIDAQLILSTDTVTKLLQLPDGWRVSSMRIHDGRVLEVDAVFPDGPTNEQPIRLVPMYKRVYSASADCGALALSSLDVVAAVPERPTPPKRWRSLR